MEDQPAVRRLSAQALRSRGYRVLEASTGDEALRLVREQHSGIDLLVSDVVVPGMSGGQLAERLGARLPELPVLFVTGHSEDELVRVGISQGPASLLSKPFTPDELVRRVAEVRESATARQDRERAGATEVREERSERAPTARV